ncbi:hypothetical protein [Lentilactobacillus senioris]|uniref:hypothetical protein n=1 Tax=Lentilactobacillus senioris TaxID=931534 RepID=UPI003D2E05ED
MRSRKENVQFIKASNPTSSDAILNVLNDDQINNLAELAKQELGNEITEATFA